MVNGLGYQEKYELERCLTLSHDGVTPVWEKWIEYWWCDEQKDKEETWSKGHTRGEEIRSESSQDKRQCRSGIHYRRLGY